MKIPVTTHSAPPALGPYSQAIRAGSFLFCAGQIPVDPVTGKVVEDNIHTQTTQVLKNIEAVLAADGLDFSHVIKSTVFLTDLKDFSVMNELYAKTFPPPFPARSTIQVAALPAGARVEIEVVAVHP